MKDGIYFGLPEHEYHALERLSASGISKLAISPGAFWAASWMNPDKEADDPDKPDRVIGRAYHCAYFEPDLVNAKYVRRPDLPDRVLRTDADVKAYLKSIGATQTKGGESADERARRLQEIDPSAPPIASQLKAAFLAEAGDRTVIEPDTWDQIQHDYASAMAHPEIAPLLTGGFAEVSILWTCPDSGISMKARIDKLHADKFVDLKSFTNTRDRPVRQAVIAEVQYRGYYRQMRLYQTAIEAAKDPGMKVFSRAETPEQAAAERAFVAVLRAHVGRLPCWLVWQEKGPAREQMADELVLEMLPEGVREQSIGTSTEKFRSEPSLLGRLADVEIERGKLTFYQCREAFGENRWRTLAPVGQITDKDFSDYFLEGEI